jgi:hypothetical protein
MAARSGAGGSTGNVAYRVRESSGTEYMLELPAGGTTLQAKAQLSRMINRHISSLILVFGGDSLCDNTSLEAAKILPGTVLTLEYRQTSLVLLTVEIPSGGTVAFRVPDDADISRIKRELQIKRPDLKAFELHAVGLELEPSTTAGELEGTTLLAISTLPGGVGNSS